MTIASAELSRAIQLYSAEPSGNEWKAADACPHCGRHAIFFTAGDTAPVTGLCRACGRDLTAEICERISTGEIPAPLKATVKAEKKIKPSEEPNWQGFTLSDYDRLKRLDVRALKALHNVTEATCRGKTVVAWPYCSSDGKVLATKLRLSHDSHDTLFLPADPHVPYGLNNPLLQNLVSKRYDLFITEGESDCHTLACWGFVVIGISGSQGWLPEFADLPIIEHAKRVFVCEDRDEGGRKFSAKVLRDLPQAFIFRTDDVKDISALHLKFVDYDADENPFLMHPFISSIDIGIQAATLEKAMRQPKPPKPKPLPMREEAFRGLAGEIVSRLEPALEAGRPAILANVLACTGVLFQRSAHFKVAEDLHYPVDFFLTVGNSSVARKGLTTNAVVRGVIEKVRPGFENKILGGLSTGEGLVKALIKKEQPEGNDSNGGFLEPIADSVLVEVSEFAGVLAVMRRDENTLSARLRDAWDGKPLQVLTRKDPLKVRNVSIATLNHITRRELVDKLNNTEKGNGFGNRHLFLWTERVKLLPKGDTSGLDFSDLVQKLHEAIEAAQSFGQVRRDEQAEELWDEEYKRLTTRGDTMVDVLLSRAEAHVARLSMLYALLDKSPVITREHLQSALAVWDYCEESVNFIFGEAADPEYARILRALEDGPLTEGEIRRRVFSDNKNGEWVAEKMAELEGLRKVRRCTKEMKTKSAPAWELVY